MTKRLIAAIVIAAAIVVAGLVLSPIIFSSSDETAQQPPTQPDAAAPTTRPIDAGEAPQAAVARITRASGEVQRRAEDGTWQPVSVGDVLEPDDVLRTGPDGVLEVDVGGAAEVKVDPDSEISVPALEQTVKQIRLGQGRVSATVPEDGGAFGVAVDGTDAVAETEAGGEFSVLTSGDGDVAVRSRRGRVKFKAKDKTVEVAEGEQSVARKDEAPSAPRAIPPSLFLKVQKPRNRISRERQLRLAGNTTPGAVISVNGVRVRVDEQGGFARVVPLKEGDNSVVVISKDVEGRTKRSEIPVVVDTTGPNVEGNVTWEN